MQRTPLSLLRAGCWLALIFVIAKAASWSEPWGPNTAQRLFTVLMSSWSDALFALVCGGIAEACAFAVQRWRYVAAAVRAFFITFFALCALYAVASIGIFQYFNRPLTYNLVALVGNAKVVRSSIVERVTLPIACGLIGIPLALVIASIWRRQRTRTTIWALVFVLAWIGSGWWYHRQYWGREKMQKLSVSPHFELLRTTARQLTGGSRPSFPKDFPREYLDEFRTFGARQPAPNSHFVPPEGVPRPRNVIFIVLESVGAKYLSPYGSALDVTPHLAAEAGQSLVFDNIYAHASFTYCSVRSLNFSLYPGLPWRYAMVEPQGPYPRTLAAQMKSRGARTGYFTSGDLDWADQRWLLEGSGAFDTLQDAAKLGCALLSSWGAEDRCAFDRLLTWLDEKPGQPFFAILWTDQTHDPYLLGSIAQPVNFFDGKPAPAFAPDLSRYLNVLKETDRNIGRVFAILRERGLADDTLVVVTGDHGEAFADPHPQRGHAWSVYDEEVRVPLMIWNPRLFAGGSRVATVGGHVDINATIADIVDVPPQADWQGHSLFDPGHPGRAYFIAIGGGDIFGIREGEWKYFYDVTSGRESLFNLNRDPQEQTDLSGAEPGKCAELRRRVAAWVTFEDAFLQGRER